MTQNVKEITDADFKSSVLNGAHPTLVDFWAPWCAPCRAIAPVVEELAGSYHGKVNFVKINIDEHQETAAKFGVKGIPTLILFKDGQVVDQVVGAVPKDQLTALIEQGL